MSPRSPRAASPPRPRIHTPRPSADWPRSKARSTAARPRAVEALFDELRRARDLRKSLADRLRRGDRIEGFGHPLYPDGDPRAALLFDLLEERFPKSKELAFALSFASAGQRVLGEKPTMDFALVALSRVLALPPGSPLTLFAIGRTIGWIAHAMEQYAQDAMIRPRARYVGEKPLQT
jgi:citrate synthase